MTYWVHSKYENSIDGLLFQKTMACNLYNKLSRQSEWKTWEMQQRNEYAKITAHVAVAEICNCPKKLKFELKNLNYRHIDSSTEF